MTNPANMLSKDARQPGVHAVTVKVAGTSVHSDRTFGLAVRAPTPQVEFTKRYTVKPGDNLDIQDAALSGLYANSALAHVAISDSPPIDVRAAVQDLLTYPYGCGEQLTSTSYPHVFIDEDEARRVDRRTAARADEPLLQRPWWETDPGPLGDRIPSKRTD